MKKKSSHSAVIYTPCHWTGNNIFFKGGLITMIYSYNVWDATDKIGQQTGYITIAALSFSIIDIIDLLIKMLMM